MTLASQAAERIVRGAVESVRLAGPDAEEGDRRDVGGDELEFGRAVVVPA